MLVNIKLTNRSIRRPIDAFKKGKGAGGFDMLVNKKLVNPNMRRPIGAF